MRAQFDELPLGFEVPGVGESRETVWDGMTVLYEHWKAGFDPTEGMKTLEGGRCQCPHWGYLIKGRIRVEYEGRTEITSAGDVYYWPAGHIPIIEEDCLLIEFSDAKTFREIKAQAVEAGVVVDGVGTEGGA